MARQNINIGTSLNDGTGDKLRDAVKKINENLIELYTRTGGDASLSESTISFSGNTIAVASNLNLTTNGAGNINANSPLVVNSNSYLGNLLINTSNLTLLGNNKFLVNGNARIIGNTTIGNDIDLNILTLNSKLAGPLIPATHNTQDVGTPSVKWKDVYVGGTVVTNVLSTANAQIVGGNINGTIIGDSNPTEGRFSILRVVDDSFLGDLLVRDNTISNRVPNDDIEIRPDGTGNVYVTTKLIVGAGSTPMTNPVLQATGDADNFTQIGVQNKNPGKFACSDIVVFTDEGSDFFDFVDMGQNNSGWDGSLQFVYFDKGGASDSWAVGNTVYQIDPADGSSILARGQIDVKVTNPLNSAEWRFRVCNIFEGTTGIFEQGSIAGVVYNETLSTSDTPKAHLIETITSTGSTTYNLGTHTLSGSTARGAFAPTVILSNDSCVVKVNGNTQSPGVDYTIQFNKIKFFTVPSVGATITIRQYPDANYPFTVGQSRDSYVYNNGKKFTIGTMTGDDVVFHVNGIRYTSEAGRIKGPSKNWIFGSGVTDKDGFSDTGEKVQIHGDIKVNGNLVLQNRTIASSTGVDGDKTGMVAIDNSYIYRCVADYDGSTSIWTRVALNATPW